MFTGIVEEIGSILEIKKGVSSAILTIRAKKVLENTKIGDSIAVNGVCLTVTKMTTETFQADVMAETLRRSSLGELGRGSEVNLERAMAADGRFGGHIVSGHIDGVGHIASLIPEDNAVWLEVETPEELLKYIIQKGSIAIDGVSLTVAKLTDHSFSISMIPHTAQETTLLNKKIGQKVNLENDIIGKYVERLMGYQEASSKKSSSLTMSMLAENGFL